jgi:hypothetical protein
VTVAQIETRIYARLDDDGTYYTPAEVRRKINEAQRFFVLLTLCLEKTVTLALDANTAFYHLLQESGFEDFLCPLRIKVVGASRLIKSRISDLDALDQDWQATAGTPDRYCQLGLDLVGLNRQPASTGTSLSITYAYAPAVLTASGSTPAIPAEYHPDLIDYAIHALRVKEGGKDFLDSLVLLGRFLENAAKLNEFMRGRNLSKRYDMLPAELRKTDISRLLGARNPAHHKPLLEKAS